MHRCVAIRSTFTISHVLVSAHRCDRALACRSRRPAGGPGADCSRRKHTGPTATHLAIYRDPPGWVECEHTVEPRRCRCESHIHEQPGHFEILCFPVTTDGSRADPCQPAVADGFLDDGAKANFDLRLLRDLLVVRRLRGGR